MRKFIFIFLMTFATLCHAQEIADVWNPAAKAVCNQINRALTYYTKGDIENARNNAIMAYFNGYDAEIEPAVRVTSGVSHVFEVEHQFRDFQAAMKPNPDKKQLEIVSNLASALCETMYADAKALNDAKVKKNIFNVSSTLDSSKISFTESLLQSFIILLREGFEALLIVTALLTYLRRANQGEKSRVIYWGVGIALFASAITAYLFATLFKNAGAHREAMEGIVMLIASAVMFYVSYWLFAKREAERWQQFIKQTMTNALSKGSLFTLGLTAFLAVYREGAETILFYQALWVGNHTQSHAILLGIGLAILALGVIYWTMQKASYKIPFNLFFTCTAAFLYYMAFYFIGGGILELQEAGLVHISPIQGFPQIAWLGIFPTWQNISVQGLFLVGTLGAVLLWHFRRRSGQAT